MKKTFLTLFLTGFITVSCNIAANAADITFTKPTLKLDTSKEQNALEKAKSDVKAKQAENEKALKAKQAEIEKAKADAKAKQAQREKEAKEKQAAREKAANQVKQDAKNTVDGVKNLFK